MPERDTLGYLVKKAGSGWKRNRIFRIVLFGENLRILNP
jgi:hypothetical protein